MDAVDERLLALLKTDARLSMADLGRRVGLSRTATLARVRRLEEAGAIRGYHAEVGIAAAEAHVARIGVVLQTPDVAAYVRRLLSIPEVSEAETVAGEFDLMVRVSTATAADLDRILDRINGWRETVRTTTFVVLKRYTI
jgi:DNA-binding Lrp family transcriptional regulator